MEQITYCGRSCENCSKKKAIGCPGCNQGPGKPIFGDCELAQCCRTKHHPTCDNCNIRLRCGLYINRANAAELRMKRHADMQKRLEETAEKAHAMSRWLRILFWLFLPNLLGRVMAEDLISVGPTALSAVGSMLYNGSYIAYCVVLFIMSRYEDQYKKAAICLLFIFVLCILSIFVPFEGWVVILLISIAALVFALLFVYYEFRAHTAFFEKVDAELCYNWTMMRKLFIIAGCFVCGSVIVAVLMMPLVIVTIIIGLLGYILIAVLKQVLLYRSAKKAEDFYKFIMDK